MLGARSSAEIRGRHWFVYVVVGSAQSITPKALATAMATTAAKAEEIVAKAMG